MSWWVKLGILIFFILSLGVGAAWMFLVGPTIIPLDFVAARTRGAELALEIGVISQNSLRSLDEIATHDKRGDRAEALTLVTRELIKNRELSDRALALSIELAKMAEQIPELRPRDARATVSEALSYEVAMVGRLLGYTASLKELFEVLRAKLTARGKSSNGRVQDLLIEINASASSINALNKAFNETMERFDRAYAR